MNIEYDHSKASHTLSDPSAMLPSVFGKELPRSLLDVGCGTGTWLKVAQQLGITDVFGVDGVAIPAGQLLISSSLFRNQDLTIPLSLGRKFDAAICFEVAEHLPEQNASTLINSLVSHSDLIIFSAGAPGQDGQNHVNCQWPEYWQKKFNESNFECSDAIRWRVWADKRIHPWYRQNVFIARRNPELAGREPRIPRVIHPECFETMTSGPISDYIKRVEKGGLPMKWYITSLLKALSAKLQKKSHTLC